MWTWVLVSHTSEAREHSANLTHNSTDPLRAGYRLQVEDLRIKFTYCCGLWLFLSEVCVCERKRKKEGQTVNENKERGILFLWERHYTTIFRVQAAPMTWSDALFGSIWEYLSAREIQEIPSGRADKFTSGAQKLGNNVIWFYKLPLGAIRCQPSINYYFSSASCNKKLLLIDSW